MLEHLEPVKVMTYFEKLCSIPHGSYNTKAISDYCVGFLQKRREDLRFIRTIQTMSLL